VKKHDVPGIIESLEKVAKEAAVLHNSFFKYDLLLEQRGVLADFFFAIAEHAVDLIIWLKNRNKQPLYHELKTIFNQNLLALEKMFSELIRKFKSASLDFGKIVNIKKLVDAIEDYRLTWPC